MTRFGTSLRRGSSWMNLWNLWMDPALLERSPPACVRQVTARASMGVVTEDGADESGVATAEIADVPEAFDDSVVLLDVREEDEWQRGPAPGARHIPMGDVPGRLAELDADATTFVVCHAGGRSRRVSEYLARNGFDPINVDGGMLAWAGAGRSVITDDGAAGAV